MGRGSYTARDWDKLRTARKITTDSSADTVVGSLSIANALIAVDEIQRQSAMHNTKNLRKFFALVI